MQRSNLYNDSEFYEISNVKFLKKRGPSKTYRSQNAMEGFVCSHSDLIER